MGRGDEARIRLPGLQADWEQYIATEPGGEIRARINYAEFLLIRERIEVAAGEQAAAEAALQDATDILLQALDESPGLAIAKTQLALAVYDRWKLNGDLPDNQVAGQLPAVRDFEMHQRSCQDINMAARLAAVRGDQAALESYTSYLLSKGYFEPGFIRFCRSRGVCAQ
jgi:hypothetical protein